MPVTETLLDKVNALPKYQQRQVEDFVELLTKSNKPKGPRRSLQGTLSHLNIDPNPLRWSEDEDLSVLNENELVHLEMEFENYEELYPRQ